MHTWNLYKVSNQCNPNQFSKNINKKPTNQTTQTKVLKQEWLKYTQSESAEGQGHWPGSKNDTNCAANRGSTNPAPHAAVAMYIYT